MEYILVFNKSIKTIALILVVAVLLPSIYMFYGVKKAEAQLSVLCVNCSEKVLQILELAEAVTNVIKNTITAIQTSATRILTADLWFKEYVLDPIAWIVAKILVRTLSNAIINWINTGNFSFDGSGLFINNFEEWLIKAGDNAAVIFLAELFGSNVTEQLCSPFRLQLLDYFRNKYILGFRLPHARCTLTNIINNIKNFQIDYKQGGNDVFVNMWLDPSNNLLGSILVEKERLENMAAQKNAAARLESKSNAGFSGWKKCVQSRDGAPNKWDDDGNPIGYVQICIKSEIKTPGGVIEKQLAEVMGSDIKTLGLADEFNEIIAAVINQLLSFTLSGGSSGGIAGYNPDSVLPPGGQGEKPPTIDPTAGFIPDNPPTTEPLPGGGELPAPTVDLRFNDADSATVPIRSSGELFWVSSNAVSCTGVGGGLSGSLGVSGSRDLLVIESAEPAIICSNADGVLASDSVRITVIADQSTTP